MKMAHGMRWALRVIVALGVADFASAAEPPSVPIRAGVELVLAVSNAPGQGQSGLQGVIQGDYEMVVSISGSGADGVTQTALLDGFDEKGVHQRGKVPRHVPSGDLQRARQQVLGFYSDDPRVLPGTTALGPSLAVTRELREKGSAQYAIRNFAKQDLASGTLTLSSPSRVKFPVIINGTRTELDALRAQGRMSAGAIQFPFETYILDHPEYPISLRVAWGPRGAGFPFEPRFAREVVRINYDKPSVAEGIEKQCRVELVGLYFDFNQATLKPESDGTLAEIADAISRAPTRALRVEGHTDSIGSDQYNDDLSARRAASVKTALVERFKVDERLLASRGYGERRPVESNDTLAGRARNRRVELVCAN